MNAHYPIGTLFRIELGQSDDGHSTDSLAEHLTSCPSCTRRWAFVLGFASGVRDAASPDVVSDAPEADHLSDARVDTIIAGRIGEDTRRREIAHLVRCDACLERLVEAAEEILHLEEAEPRTGAPRFRVPGQLTPWQRLVRGLVGNAVPFAAGAVAAAMVAALALPGSETSGGLTARDPTMATRGTRPAGRACASDDDCASHACLKTRIDGELQRVCRLAEGEPCSGEDGMGLCAVGLVCTPDGDGTRTCRAGECRDDRECPAARPRCLSYTCSGGSP